MGGGQGSALQRTVEVDLPFEAVESFRLVAVVDGERLDLADIGERMQSAALVHYDFNFDGVTLRMKGRTKLALLRPPKKADRAEFIREIEADKGRDLRDFLLGKPRAADLNLRRSSGGWLLEFEQVERLDELPGAVPPGAVPASPGPFTGAIDGYSLTRPAVDEQEVFSTASEFKGLIQALAGIRVYRDGFGVRVRDDWLQLGRTWSTGTSWYGLKPQSSLGYVAISARDNAQLVETTDREGFKETQALINLRLLMKRFLKFSEDVQGFIGRETAEFKDQLDTEPPEEDHDDAVVQMEAALERGRTYAMEVGKSRETLVKAVVNATDLADDLDDEDPLSLEVKKIVGAVARNVTAANVLLEQLSRTPRNCLGTPEWDEISRPATSRWSSNSTWRTRPSAWVSPQSLSRMKSEHRGPTCSTDLAAEDLPEAVRFSGPPNTGVR